MSEFASCRVNAEAEPVSPFRVGERFIIYRSNHQLTINHSQVKTNVRRIRHGADPVIRNVKV